MTATTAIVMSSYAKEREKESVIVDTFQIITQGEEILTFIREYFNVLISYFSNSVSPHHAAPHALVNRLALNGFVTQMVGVQAVQQLVQALVRA